MIIKAQHIGNKQEKKIWDMCNASTSCECEMYQLRPMFDRCSSRKFHLTHHKHKLFAKHKTIHFQIFRENQIV